ncbi:hypothetical protein [Kitasatospora sp. NPDC097643]|uniref:hypothetical protein n=1 Tax=Kitasatospora sp. NPDC097643 TaxID=3157230 RepID=UPI003327EDBE
MARHGRTTTATARRRDGRHTGLLRAAARWSERADRSTGWTRRGVERCRRWAREGARRPGELAPPSWFAIALPFGVGWYLVLGGIARVWCRVADRSCRVLARAL